MLTDAAKIFAAWALAIRKGISVMPFIYSHLMSSRLDIVRFFVKYVYLKGVPKRPPLA
jgi:hypothetical protein